MNDTPKVYSKQQHTRCMASVQKLSARENSGTHINSTDHRLPF
jgi:hypothetical protein